VKEDAVTLDVRSLGEWVKDIFGRGRLSGGGPLGVPSLELEDAAPGIDEESDGVVSGGGGRTKDRRSGE
jgi:hypothetical protein